MLNNLLHAIYTEHFKKCMVSRMTIARGNQGKNLPLRTYEALKKKKRKEAVPADKTGTWMCQGILGKYFRCKMFYKTATFSKSQQIQCAKKYKSRS